MVRRTEEASGNRKIVYSCIPVICFIYSLGKISPAIVQMIQIFEINYTGICEIIV